jgi:hypothetical protein
VLQSSVRSSNSRFNSANHPIPRTQPNLTKWLLEAHPDYVRYVFWHGTGWRNVVGWLCGLVSALATGRSVFMAVNPDDAVK